MPKPFSKQFRLSITKALGDQLAEELANLTPAPLTKSNLENLEHQAQPRAWAANQAFTSFIVNHREQLNTNWYM